MNRRKTLTKLFNRAIRRTHRLALLAALLMVVSCQQTRTPDDDYLTVSIEPLRFVVDYLSEGTFNVSTLAPDTINPETYTITQEQLTSLSEGTVYIRMGTLPFEHLQLRKLAAMKPHMYIINASEDIAPIHSCSQCSHEDEVDPHTWTSPFNMKRIAENICLALEKIRPEGTLRFNQRLEKFKNYVDSIDSLVQKNIEGTRRKNFLINHSSLRYFALDYGLHQVTLEDAATTDKELTHEDYVEFFRKNDVQLLFLQPQHEQETARKVAEELGIRIVEINPLVYDWGKEILHISQAFKD